MKVNVYNKDRNVIGALELRGNQVVPTTNHPTLQYILSEPIWPNRRESPYSAWANPAGFLQNLHKAYNGTAIACGQAQGGGEHYSLFGKETPERYEANPREAIRDLEAKHGTQAVLSMLAGLIHKMEPLEGTAQWANKFPLEGTQAFARLPLVTLLQLMRMVQPQD